MRCHLGFKQTAEDDKGWPEGNLDLTFWVPRPKNDIPDGFKSALAELAQLVIKISEQKMAYIMKYSHFMSSIFLITQVWQNVALGLSILATEVQIEQPDEYRYCDLQVIL